MGFKYFRPLLPFSLGLILILSSQIFTVVGAVNALLQGLLFALVVCLPLWRTGRISYMDIGWPWGLVVLAIVGFLFSNGHWARSLLVTLAVATIGLRMGIGALRMWKGGRLQKELPRYQYQRVRWQQEGKDNVALAAQIEAIIQGLANASFLAMPIFIIGTNATAQLFLLELLGLVIWAVFLVAENTADMQKLHFLRSMKKQGNSGAVCDVGLWRYSRHPNYFCEWMVWNGLVIAAIPSWLALSSSLPQLVWALLGLATLMASFFMYRTLVYTTGAIPAEYYSAQKRPGYQAYQQRTNRFFPGRPKPIAKPSQHQ
jgi:steroid 5-alpha reductase family enzyme